MKYARETAKPLQIRTSMKFSFTYITPFRLFPVIILSVLYAVIQTLVFNPIVSFPFVQLLLKGAIDAVVLTGIGMSLMIIIPSANYVRLGTYQRYINCFAIGILFVGIWVTLSYFSSYMLFGEEHMAEIKSLLPISAFIGLMMYVILVQIIHARILREEGTVDDNGERDDEPDEAVATAVSSMGDTPESEVLERVAVKTGQKIHVILVPDIVYIQSDGDYVQIVTEHNKYLKEETMKYFEASLPGSQFVRVHRSYIVNVEKILRIELYEKQNQMLTLKNGDQVRASVSGYKALRAVLNL